MTYKEYEYPKDRPSLEQTEKWFCGNKNGIAVLLGAASYHTYCLDDDEGILNEITGGNLDAFHTLREVGPDPKRSHLFLKDKSCQIGKLDFRLAAPGSRQIQAEIKGNGQLVTLAPSLHRKMGLPYSTVSPVYKIREVDGIIQLLVDKMKELGWRPPESQQYAGASKLNVELTREIEDVQRAVDILVPYWKKANTFSLRSRFLIALSGYLIRKGIKEEAAVKFVSALTKSADDSRSTSKAVYRMRSLYRSSKNAPRVQGFPSLVRVLQTIERSE